VYQIPDFYVRLLKHIEMKKTSSLILLLLISSLPTLSQNLSQSSYYKVYFDSDKHHVRQTEHQELQKLIKKAQNAGYYEIDIQAHTDFDGSISYNQKLSERRAQSVVGFLVNQGLSKDHFTYHWHGEGKPVSTNATETGKQLNRRVEIRLRTYQFKTASDVLKAVRKDDAQEFRLKPGSQRVTARKGTSVHIPEGAFVDDQGKVVKNQYVTLKIQEFHDLSDAIFHQLSTQSGGQILESGGMFRLEARRGNEELKVSKEKALNVSLPSKNIQKDMQVFTGVEKENGDMDWAPVATPFELVRKDGKKAPTYKVDVQELMKYKQTPRALSVKAQKPLLYTIPIAPKEPKAPKKPKEPEYPDLNKVFTPFWTKVLPTALAKQKANKLYEQDLARYERRMERYDKVYERYLSKMEIYRSAQTLFEERIHELYVQRKRDSIQLERDKFAILQNIESKAWNIGLKYVKRRAEEDVLRENPRQAIIRIVNTYRYSYDHRYVQIQNNLSFLQTLDTFNNKLMARLEKDYKFTIVPYESGALSYYQIVSTKAKEGQAPFYVGYERYAIMDSLLTKTPIRDVLNKSIKEYTLAKANSGPITHSSLTSVYNASINTTGFINCDRFYKVPKEQMVRISIPDAKEEKINFIIPEMNSSLYAYPDGENGKFVNVPRGKELKMVVIGLEDGAPTLETRNLTAREDITLTIDPKKITLDEFQETLASL
jgi:hypothetical protein